MLCPRMLCPPPAGTRWPAATSTTTTAPSARCTWCSPATRSPPWPRSTRRAARVPRPNRVAGGRLARATGPRLAEAPAPRSPAAGRARALVRPPSPPPPLANTRQRLTAGGPCGDAGAEQPDRRRPAAPQLPPQAAQVGRHLLPRRHPRRRPRRHRAVSAVHRPVGAAALHAAPAPPALPRPRAARPAPSPPPAHAGAAAGRARSWPGPHPPASAPPTPACRSCRVTQLKDGDNLAVLASRVGAFRVYLGCADVH